jgi:hypothetical protein
MWPTTPTTSIHDVLSVMTAKGDSLDQQVFIAEHFARELFVNDGDRWLIWL